MLGKLMKYEFLATGRIFLPLFAALLVISAVNRLLSGLGDAPYGISMVLAIMLIAGVFVAALILTIQRFWQNLLSAEGHLMFTLPVKTDSLILSKLFTASIWHVASFLVALAAILIMASADFNITFFEEFFKVLSIRLSRVPAGYVTLCVVEGILYICLCIFANVLSLYVCMALSMLANRRRGLYAFGIYIAISTVLQIIVAIAAAIFTALELEFRFLTNLFGNLDEFWQAQLVIAVIIVFCIVLNMVSYFVTRYMLKNKLNLQ